METVAILGPGGVGGFLAAALDHAGLPALVVAREATAELIAHDGIGVESVRLGSFHARPRASTRLDEPAQALLLATKATTLGPALERVDVVPPVIVPLLNGLEHMDVLRRRFGSDRVAAGTIRIESTALATGRIAQTSPFLRVDMASASPTLQPRLKSLAAALEGAGVPARIESSEAQILWSKLTRLVALACTTSASGETIGFIRSDPEWRQALVAALGEAASVANAEGAEIDPADPLAELDDAHPSLGSSMQRDIAAGRQPELDAIAGAVIRAGRRRGLACPTLERLRRDIARRAGVAEVA